MSKSLTKFDSPFLDLAKKVFGNDFNYLPLVENGSGLSNVLENENEYRIELSAPGLKKDDIDIELENDVLKISSNFEDKKEENNEGYYRREFYKSSFERSFSVPKGVNRDDISATMDNGILIVSIPKLKEEKKNENVKITIK